MIAGWIALVCKGFVESARVLAVHCELEAGGVVFFTFGTPHATGDNQEVRRVESPEVFETEEFTRRIRSVATSA